MLVFILIVLIIIGFLAWVLDHLYGVSVVQSYIRALADERADKASYKRSYEEQSAKVTLILNEKSDFAFKVSQETATLKAKIRKIAKDLDEMVT